MPGQWHEPGRTAGHSTSMCPVLFITLQFCSSYFFPYLFLILNISLLDIIHTSHTLVNFTAYFIKQKLLLKFTAVTIVSGEMPKIEFFLFNTHLFIYAQKSVAKYIVIILI